MRSIALLANPDSGSGAASELPETLRQLGATVEEFEIGQFDEAASSGADRLVVAGGDGSIAPAAQAAARHGVPLAVLPAGTANDFARAHGLPDDLDEACRIAVEGEQSEAIEIAEIDDRAFLNVASIGLSTVSAEKAHGLKSLLGPLAYAIGALQAGLTAGSVTCKVICNGGVWFEGEAWQLTVACSGAFGGGSQIEADPADGKLDVVVIEANSRLRLPLHAYGLRTGGVEGQTGVRSLRCSELRVETPGPLDYNVDGELIEVSNPSFTVEERAVELIHA